MKFRKRLHKACQRLVDSSEENYLPQEEPSNLLSTINNQKLYLKLVGITLAMSKEAGVTADSLKQLESKLLGSKGFDQFPMLNSHPHNEMNNVEFKNKANRISPYLTSKKYMEPNEQLIFLKLMEKQVDQTSAKENLVLALKKYVEKQKKTLNMKIIKPEHLSRKKKFQNRVSRNSLKKSVSKKNLYQKNLADVLDRISKSNDQSYEIIGKMIPLKTFWGHTFFQEAEQEYCPVYNTIFDNTQRLIITGGQDGLIKIWSRQSGLLLTSLRGHSGFINKFCVSKCNKYLFSAAQDGVRFFDIQKMSSNGGMQLSYVFDIGQINNDEDPENFYIMFADQERVFVTDKNTMQLHKQKKMQHKDFLLFNFRHKIKGEGINVNTFLVNPQKNVFLGLTTGQIVIFNFHHLKKAIPAHKYIQSLSEQDHLKTYPFQNNQFILPIIHVLNAHEDEIIQIKWNPIFSCLSTGSKKDGSCRIWDFKLEQNPKPVLVKELKIPKTKIKRKKKIYACNFLCWNCTYTHMVCSFMEESQQDQSQYRGDGEILVYSTHDYDITWQMSKSADLSSITCIDTHPKYENIALICDSSGKLILVDIFENFIINIFQERAFHLGHPAFCLVPSQCRFSQDGYSFVVATQYGNVSLYGYDIKDFYDMNPLQQFFRTDYEHFQINPTSMKPVLAIDSNIDINQLSRGQFCNLRKQPYENYEQINVAQLIQSTSIKIRHLNSPILNIKDILKTFNRIKDYDRNMEVYKQNIQQMENKRLTTLFQERQQRSHKVKAYIQEKVRNLRELDASLTQHFTDSLNLNQILAPNDTQNQNHISTRNQGRRGRGRGRLRNVENQRANRNIINSSQDQIQPQSYNNHSQDYQAESQIQAEDQEDIDQFDDEYDGNESDPVYMHRNRSRRYQQSNNIQGSRRSQRITGVRNRFGIYEVQNDDEQVSGIRRRRNVNQQIQMLLDEINNEPRKRTNEQNQTQQRKKPSRSYNNRRNHIQQIKQIPQQGLEICDLCNMNKVCKNCSKCQKKHFCEQCQIYRMRKRIMTDNQYNYDRSYVCLKCYFIENMRPESNKNLNQSKYLINARISQEENNKYEFIPQIDDLIAYFPEGYEQFLQQKLEILNNKVLNLDLFGVDQDKFQILPQDIQGHSSLTNVSKCIVRQLKYVFPLSQGNNGLSYSGNRRANRASYSINNRSRANIGGNNNDQDVLMFIRLEKVQKLEEDKNIEFWVYYIPGYDFLLKWEIYDDIIKNDKYSKIQMFKMAEMNGQQVQFMEIKPYNQYLYPSSIWKNIIIHKGESKNLRKSKEHNQQIAINIWQIRSLIDQKAFQYQTNFTKQSRDKYLSQIHKIENFYPDSWMIFKDFVDTDVFISYYEHVQVGMCLSLIIERLNNNYYRSQDSFMRDMTHLTQNSISFNGEHHQITELCQQLVHQVLFGSNFDVNLDSFQRIQPKVQETQKKAPSKGRQSSNKSKKGQIFSNEVSPQNNTMKVSKFQIKNRQQEQEYFQKNVASQYEQGFDSDEEQWKHRNKKKKIGKDKKIKGTMENDLKNRMKNTRIKKRINVIQSDSEDFPDGVNDDYLDKKSIKREKQQQNLRSSSRRPTRNHQRNDPIFDRSQNRTSGRITRSRHKN